MSSDHQLTYRILTLWKIVHVLFLFIQQPTSSSSKGCEHEGLSHSNKGANKDAREFMKIMVIGNFRNLYMSRQGYSWKGEKNVQSQMPQQGSVSLDTVIIYMCAVDLNVFRFLKGHRNA